MIIYVLAIFWILFCYSIFAGNDYAKNKEGYASKAHSFLAMSFLVFFIGLRSAGADTEAYILGFNSYSLDFNSCIEVLFETEGLFKAFGLFVKSIFNNYHVYLFIIAVIIGYAVSKTFRKYTPYYTLAMVLYILTGTYTWMINGIRQFLAASLAFLSVDYILERKPIKYFVVILILSKIHASALILMPVYFFVTGKPFSKKTLVVLAVSIFAVMFTKEFTSILDSALENTVYENVTHGEIWINDDGSNIIRTFIFLVPVVFSWIERKNIQENAPAIVRLSVNMSIICVCFSVIANVTSGIFIGRLPVYFSLYNLILLPWLVNNTKTFKNKQTIKVCMIILYCMLFLYDGGMYYYSNLLFGGKVLPAW